MLAWRSLGPTGRHRYLSPLQRYCTSASRIFAQCSSSIPMMIKQHWLSRAGQSAGSVSSRAPPHRRPFSSFLESSSSRLPPNASFSTLHTPIENQSSTTKSNSNPQKQSKWSKQVRRSQPLVQPAKQAASNRSYSIAPGTPRALRRRPETHSHVIRCTLRVLTGPHEHLDGHVPRSDDILTMAAPPCTRPSLH